MTKLAIALSAVLVAGCQTDNQNLERKLDQIIAKIDQRIAAGGNRGAQRPRRPEPDRAKTYAVPVAGDPFVGPADAKITLVKAYDYACPYCEKVRPTMAELRKKYGNDLRIVYKQLVVHPRNAMAAALAFCAAAKQGKHEAMDELLWDKGFKARNMDLSDAGGKKCWDTAEGCKATVAFATELQLDVGKFKADMKGECQQVVQADMRALSQLGVAATPGFFVNGRFLSGAQPLDKFTALIDEELKKANDRVPQGTVAAGYYQKWVLDKGQKTLGG